MILKLYRHAILGYEYKGTAHPDDVQYRLDGPTKWCCKRLEDMVHDAGSPIQRKDRKDGGLFVGWHYKELEYPLEYCPFCGEKVTVEKTRGATYQLVEKQKMVTYYEMEEVSSRHDGGHEEKVR